MTELDRVKEFMETLEFHGYIDHDPTKLNALIDDYYPLKQGQLLPIQNVNDPLPFSYTTIDEHGEKQHGQCTEGYAQTLILELSKKVYMFEALIEEYKNGNWR